jgi:AcrR family transcriptional regulator
VPPKSQPSDRPRPGEGPGLKSQLIAAARFVLERDGLEALSLRAAAREAGVSHMAPYRHFKDKDELLAAVAGQGFRALTAYMDGAIAAQGTPEAAGVAYVSFALENPALYKLMFGAKLVAPSRFPELAAAGAEAFERCLAASEREGATGEQLRLSAVALWSLVHGFASLAIDGLTALPPEGCPRDAYIAAVLNVKRAG